MNSRDRTSHLPPTLEALEPRLLLDAAPTAYDQYLLELINRGRANPAAEAARYGVALNEGLPAGTISGDPKQPVAFNASLIQAAQGHSQWMLDTNIFAHQGAGGSWPWDRAQAAGYPCGFVGENISWAGTTGTIDDMTQWTAQAHEGLYVDAGIAGRGHRINQLNPDWKEVGAGVLRDPFVYQGKTYDSVMVTEDFGDCGGLSLLTGVAYDDGLVLADDFYTPGEGLGDVTVTAVRQGDGAEFSAQTWPSGGYTLPLAAGTYDVYAANDQAVILYLGSAAIGSQNVKVDVASGFDVPPPDTPTGLTATDGAHTDKVTLAWNAVNQATSYEVWRHDADDSANANLLGTTVVTSFDDDTASAGTTYYYWVKANNAAGASDFSHSDAGYVNAAPTIGSLTGAPDPVLHGNDLTLTANNLDDADGSVNLLAVYHDSDDNGAWENTDALLGQGQIVGTSATWTGSTSPFSYGANRFFARARDNQLGWSDAVATVVTVDNPDPVPPAAALAADDLTISRHAAYEFNVTYTDNVAIDWRTAGSGDVRVTGPNGFDKPAPYLAIDDRSDGTPRTVTYQILGPGHTWDFTDNGTYTVSMQADQVTDTNDNAVAPGVLGTFDVTISDKPDLTVEFATISLPASCVPGDSVRVSITITNEGGVTADGTIVNNLWLSDDQALGGDTLFATQNTRVRLAPGLSRTYSFRASVPGDAQPADLFILADVDATNVIDEQHEDNNLAATPGAYAVVWQFGHVGTRAGVRLTVNDTDGTPVTFGLRGAGTGEVTVGAEGLDLTLTGTDNRSYVSVDGPRRGGGGDGDADLGNIVVGNPVTPGDETSLGGFYGRTADLAGDFTVTGGLTLLYLDEIAGGRTLTVSAWPDARASLSLYLNVVQDFCIDSAMPIRSLRAIAWLDNDLAPDVIDAPSVSTLTINGQRGNARRGIADVPGDFQADLALSGEGDPRQTLTNARIAGSLTGAAWDVTGDVGTVTVSGEADGWTLDVHSDVRSLRLGDVTDATVTVDGKLGTLSALRWAGGGVTAKTLRSLNVAGRRGNARRGTEDVPGDFGANLTLMGDPAATGRRNQTLGSVRISGELRDSAWDITGPVGSVMIGHVAASLHLPDVSSISTGSLLIRCLHGDLPVGLIAVEGAGQVNHITFDSIRRWPRTTCDLVSEVGDPPPVAPTVFGAMTLASLKNHLGSALGRWTGDPSRLRPGLLASFDRTKDPTYRFVQRTAFVYDNALAIETLLMGNNPDAECRARAFQIADALVLLQDHDPNNAGAAAAPEFPALTPAPLRDAYRAGTVATSRDATKITVRTAGFDNASSGNQAYAAMALVRAADVAEEHGEAERAADYRKTAKELLLSVAGNRMRPDPLRGFAMSEDAAVGQARATEHNIDLAAAFGRMADAEADPALKAKWEAWRDRADHFRNRMYGANERFATLPWIRDDWQYFRAGTGLADDINKDLASLDTGAWSSLGRGDDRDVAFDLLEFLATSTDATGRTYTGFDPGFRAVADDSLTSRRDGIGSEATAYMALIARKLGDGAILAALPGRATLTADEQAAYDLVLGKANDGETDHDLADFLAGQLVNIQLHAPNGDGLGLVAAPVPGVGTGEYDLVNGWALASTCWARFAFQGWNIFTASSTL